MRTCIPGGLLAALLFVAIWLPLQPPREHLPTSDLYTHLSVARHLLRGDGFVTDLAYPLSFAFPFAQALPQPLIYRPPGYALWLMLPQAIGGDDSARVLAAVRIQQLAVLAMMAALGVIALLRRGNGPAIGIWLVLLLASPILGFAVDWAFVELLSAGLLLGIWLESRGQAGTGPRAAVLAGILAGALMLLRPELCWIPAVWWMAGSQKKRRYLLAVVLALVIASPWAVRNLRLTGDPLFSLQGNAELVKMTRTWPGYSVYRQLEPQPMVRALRADPLPILRKGARGVRQQLGDLHRLLPSWVWWGGSVFLLLRIKQRSYDSVPLVLGLSLGGLILFYAFFDAGLRHLVVLVPVLMFETAVGSARAVGSFLNSSARPLRPQVVAAGLGAVALLLTWMLPCRLPGWQQSLTEAASAGEAVRTEVEQVLSSKEPWYFTEYSAVPYLSDRPAIWMADSPADRERIRQLLAD